MKYLCLIYEDERIWEKMPKAEADKTFGEYFAFNAATQKSGHLLGGHPLQPTQTATTVRVRNGKTSTTDGPFAETKEQLGGYYLIEAKDLNDALQVAARIPGARLGCVLGTISDIGPRGDFKVAGLVADHLGGSRVALVGEAAHILPPIGAQGLNLGFRDAAALADCVADALNQGRDPGGPEAIDAYVGARRLDVMSRSLGVDLMSRSLLTSLPPLQAARGLLMQGLQALPPLRR